MCGRFTITVTIGLPERFGIACCDIPLTPRYNIAPSQEAPVVFHPYGSGRVCRAMTWGLRSSRPARAPQGYSRPVNARAETLHERHTFSALLDSRRCLIPATGFYEWVKQGRPASVPYYIRRKDNQLFSFAGLYDISEGPSGGSSETFVIITTAPNILTGQFHDRMPAILRPEDEDRWISPGCLSPCEIREVLSPYPDDLLTAFRVSRAVNDPGRDDPSLVQEEPDSQLPLA